MIDKLRSMAVFVAVVEEGSFRRAGIRLDLSPSVVSHHVSNLESRLDTQLLTRGPRSVDLTDAGRALYQPARRMITAADDALRAIDVSRDMLSGRLRISIAHFMAAGRFHLVLEEFLRANPRVTVDLHMHRRSRNPLTDDFHIVVGTENLSNGDIASAPVPTTRCGIYAAPDLAERIEKTPAAEVAQTIPLILTAGFSESQWKTLLSLPRHQELKFRFSCEDIILAHQLCRLGIGMSVLPHMMIRQDLQSGQLKEVLPRLHVPQLQLYVNWARESELEPLAQAFLSHLMHYFEKMPG